MVAARRCWLRPLSSSRRSIGDDRLRHAAEVLEHARVAGDEVGPALRHRRLRVRVSSTRRGHRRTARPASEQASRPPAPHDWAVNIRPSRAPSTASAPSSRRQVSTRRRERSTNVLWSSGRSSLRHHRHPAGGRADRRRARARHAAQPAGGPEVLHALVRVPREARPDRHPGGGRGRTR